MFRSPARSTFANSGKSGQKRRSNLRFENPPAPRTIFLASVRPTRARQSVDRPKCGIDLLLSPLPLKIQNVELRTGAFQSKSGSAQRNTSVQHFGRTRTHRQSAEGNPKTMGFGGVLSPISFAAERNGAAGGKKEIILPPRAKPPRAGGAKERKKRTTPRWFFSAVLVHSVMIRRITRSVSRIPCAASTPTWRTVSSTSVPRMPSPGRKLSPLRYMS